MPLSAASAPGGAGGVTVGAQQPQVLPSIVAPVPVDVVHFQRHGPAEPLGSRTALVAAVGYADRAERPTQQRGPRAAFAPVLDQDVIGLPERCGRAGLAPPVRLPQEVRCREIVFSDPSTQEGPLRTAVVTSQPTEHTGDRHAFGDRGTQFHGRGPGPAASASRSRV